MRQVEWHPFPKERDKIKYGRHYFVTCESDNVLVTQATKPEYGYHDEFGDCWGQVIAFSEIELPEPYKPEEKNEKHT